MDDSSSSKPQIDQLESPKKRLPKNKFRLLFGAFFLVLLPALIIGAVLGSRIVRTDQGADLETHAAGSDPAVVGQWSTVFDLPVKATHTNLLSNGKILTWPSFTEGDNPTLFDPVTNTSIAASQSGLNIFCAGHVTMTDGEVFVAGGHVVTPIGIPTATVYNPKTNTWKRLPDMNAPRWYPTTHVMPNGDILVISGSIQTGVTNDIPQIWDIKKKAWRTLTGAKLGVGLYPRMMPAPNGKLFMVGTNQGSRYLDTSGTGSWGGVINSNFGKRISGTAVEYAKGKILITAGASDNTLPGTSSAEIIDLNATNPKWTYTSSMSVPRTHANSTILPTGQVLVTGGSSGVNDDQANPVYLAEMWTPTTGKWTQLSSNSTYRGYHSTALLLPDGRVFIGGGEKSGNSAEFFSPPYLFQGARPTITAAPAGIDFGKTFTIKTPDAADITKIRWIRIGSVTHSFNESQIINQIAFTKIGTNTLQLTAPPNGNTAPPGFYMLFILNSKGVPSVAKIINFGNIPVDFTGVISPTTTFSTSTNPNEANTHMKMSGM